MEDTLGPGILWGCSWGWALQIFSGDGLVAGHSTDSPGICGVALRLLDAQGFSDDALGWDTGDKE